MCWLSRCCRTPTPTLLPPGCLLCCAGHILHGHESEFHHHRLVDGRRSFPQRPLDGVAFVRVCAPEKEECVSEKGERRCRPNQVTIYKNKSIIDTLKIWYLFYWDINTWSFKCRLLPRLHMEKVDLFVQISQLAWTFRTALKHKNEYLFCYSIILTSNGQLNYCILISAHKAFYMIAVLLADMM